MKKLMVLLFLMLSIMAVVSACDPIDGTQPSVEVVPADTQIQNPTQQTDEPIVITETPETTPTDEDIGALLGPREPMVPSVDKPSLAFSDSADGDLHPVVAFTFPEGVAPGPLAIKVAAFVDIRDNPYESAGKVNGFTPVGVLEIGPDSDQGISGIYLVAIDLDSLEERVEGNMFPLNAAVEIPLTFQRIPQEVNLARTQSSSFPIELFDSPPDNSVTITANGVCFVINSDVLDLGMGYIRYCSQGNELSARANFSASYENLMGQIIDFAASFGIQDQIQQDQIISEMEDPSRINTCREMIEANELQEIQQACGSDITVAPLELAAIERNFIARQDQAIEVLSVPMAFIQVHQSINTTISLVEPGVYQMDYWFYRNGEFFAATISGTMENGNPVTDQQIPAVPAAFVNRDGSEQPGAQISACRIFGRCTFFQNSCY
jgi:hypothetical protein